MREIKFRAWDKTLNMIHCWSAIENHFTFEELLDTNFFEAMQYTGLKDKNGREIFDGDTICFTERAVGGLELTHTCQVFQHERGTWRVEGHPDFDTIYKTRRELYSIKHICEVIGNKYENPELLK